MSGDEGSRAGKGPGRGARLTLWRQTRLRVRLLRRRMAMVRVRTLDPLIARLERPLMTTQAGIAVEQAPLGGRRAGTVLLAVAHPDTAAYLGRYAAALAGDNAVIVTTVIPPEVARELRADIKNSTGDPAVLGLEQLPAVRLALTAASGAGAPTGFVVRGGNDVGQALRREARRQRAGLVILGWNAPARDSKEAAGTSGSRDKGASGSDHASIWGAGTPQDVDAIAAERKAIAPSLRAVIEYPPTDVAIIAGGVGPEDDVPNRWLVPLGLGGDTLAALQLASTLKGPEGSLTALRVMPETATMPDLQDATSRLSQTLALLGHGEAGQLSLRAVDIPTGVVDAVTQRGYQGVVLAAPSETLIDRLVLGSAQLEIARRCDRPVVVSKARSGALTYAVVWVWRQLYDRLPKLDAAEQEEVEEEISLSATPRLDFYVMIGLSAMIAGFGLLLDSPAVIIGAMLVAPLMAAIVGVGLGVVEGRLGLIRRGLTGSMRGALIAIGVGVLVGLVHPRGTIGPEIASRTQPGLLDLGVALASGAAGAYALSRKGVSASLAGVAIAAALVPPLTVCGIGIALWRWDVALGALLLFLANFISIAAAGGLVFLLLGFGPSVADPGEREVLQQGLRTAAWLLLTVALVLGAVTWRLAADVKFERQLEQVLHDEIENNEAYTQFQPLDLESWKHSVSSDGTVTLEVALRLKAELAAAFSYQISREIQDALSARLGRPVALTLKIVPTRVLDARQAPTYTPSPTSTMTPSPTITPSPTPTTSPTATGSATATASPSATVTRTPVVSPTLGSGLGASGVLTGTGAISGTGVISGTGGITGTGAAPGIGPLPGIGVPSPTIPGLGPGSGTGDGTGLGTSATPTALGAAIRTGTQPTPVTGTPTTGTPTSPSAARSTSAP